MFIGIIVAMEEEAQPIIKALDLKKAGARFYIGRVQNNNYILCISGIGKVNAQNAAWKLASLGIDSLANVGTCGDLGNHGVGTVIFPNVFFDGDYDLEVLGDTGKDPAGVNERYTQTADASYPLERIDCYSYSTFITDKRVEDAIVDMESYAIAAVAKELNCPFLAIKCTSDSADEDATNDFNGNVESVIERNIGVIKSALVDFEKSYQKVYKVK